MEMIGPNKEKLGWICFRPVNATIKRRRSRIMTDFTVRDTNFYHLMLYTFILGWISLECFISNSQFSIIQVFKTVSFISLCIQSSLIHCALIIAFKRKSCSLNGFLSVCSGAVWRAELFDDFKPLRLKIIITTQDCWKVFQRSGGKALCMYSPSLRLNIWTLSFTCSNIKDFTLFCDSAKVDGPDGSFSKHVNRTTLSHIALGYTHCLPKTQLICLLDWKHVSKIYLCSMTGGRSCSVDFFHCDMNKVRW